MTGPTTRARETLFHLGTWEGKLETVNSNSSNVIRSSNRGSLDTVKGKQVTVSSGHPFHSRKRNEPGDLGGDFFTQRTYLLPEKSRKRVSVTAVNQSTLAGGVIQTRSGKYVGPVYPVQPTSSYVNGGSQSTSRGFPPAANSSNAQLDAIGASAVAHCKPTNSVADASVFLGELFKEGIPNLIGHATWKDKTSVAKKASSEYLTSEFGWKPIVSDVKKFAYAVNHANTVLEQYERDSGRQVRRQYHFPVQRSTVTETLATGVSPYGPSQYGAALVSNTPKGNVVRTRETVQRRWFSGAFTYHLPTGYSSRDAMARHALEAKKLLGLSLTPETLWNLAPWSWAVDWFTNTGDVVSNISDWATDGLVMRYGYIMEHTIVKDTYTLDGPTGIFPKERRVLPLTFVTETKIRRRANPFGFGLTFDGLTIRQQAIALALGLTRW